MCCRARWNTSSGNWSACVLQEGKTHDRLYTNSPIMPGKAKELLALDTKYKEIITYGKIEEWYTAWDGKVYVSFSGGKDSTVLAYLVANWCC